MGAADLRGVLGERLHHVNHVDNLELSLLAGLDRFLPGNHQHWHAAELGIGRCRHQVRCPRP